MFDWINGITADATTAFRAVVFLAAAVIFFVVAAKVTDPDLFFLRNPN